MPSYWNSKTGYSYVSSNYNMDSHTHGGHEREHKEEMERIANDVCSQMIQSIIPGIEEQAYNKAISNLLSALKCDVETIVSIGFEQGAEIFNDKRTQTIIMSAIYKEITNLLQTRYTIH